MNILTKTSLTNEIFSNLNQVAVFSKYTGIPEYEITKCLNNKNKKTNNILRIDNSASLGFMWALDKRTGEHKIKMYDFADSYWRGDIIDIVGKLLQLNPCNNMEFVKICEHIITNSNSETSLFHNTNVKAFKPNRDITQFGVEIRPFTNKDLEYWKRRGLDKTDLEKGLVFAINSYWVLPNDTLSYHYSPKDVCYGYLLDNIKGVSIWKFYFIHRGRDGDNRSRFITNNQYPLESFNELVPADILFITKSRGDKLITRKLFTQGFLFSTGERTITVTNFTSESVRLTKTISNWIYSNYKIVFINTDFDREGIRCAQYHKKEYDMIPLFLTNGKYGTMDYGAKDIKDYIYKFGEHKSIDLINSVIENIIIPLL